MKCVIYRGRKREREEREGREKDRVGIIKVITSFGHRELQLSCHAFQYIKTHTRIFNRYMESLLPPACPCVNKVSIKTNAFGLPCTFSKISDSIGKYSFFSKRRISFILYLICTYTLTYT